MACSSRGNELDSSTSISSTSSDVDSSVTCCLPSGCKDPFPVNLHDSVKLTNSSEQCICSLYMHNDCFLDFEDTVLQFLKQAGRSRSWSEKQKRQNIWTKRGYDIAYKACLCKCKKGHLKKDLDRVDEFDVGGHVTKTKKKKRKSNEKPILILSTSPPNRSRTISGCSTGSEGTGLGKQLAPKDNAFSFSRRADYTAFVSILPKQKLNPYQIKMEDETYGGNYDENRNYVLTNLTNYKVHTVQCVLCQRSLTVYDRYPLIDGTFFLSILKSRGSSIELTYNDMKRYLTAVCIHCLQGNPHKVLCKFCDEEWHGDLYQLGTLYNFDIFAANPCCGKRLQCNSCSQNVMKNKLEGDSYSWYAQRISCFECGAVDYHLIKPYHEFFKLRKD